MQTWVVLNDIQIPFQDKPVLELVLGFIDKLKPDGVILNGDVTDCYELSVYTKNPMTRAKLNVEIVEAGMLMRRLEKIEHKFWLGGNHEDRLRRYLWREAPALDLDETSFPTLYHLAAYGFVYKPYGGFVKLGKLFVTHGTQVNKHSAYTAKNNFDKMGTSMLVGHTHRLGAYYKRNQQGVHVSYENGCLCRLDPEYVQFPDWQQGFSVVHVGDKGLFNVQQIPILKRRVFFYGKEKFSR